MFAILLPYIPLSLEKSSVLLDISPLINRPLAVTAVRISAIRRGTITRRRRAIITLLKIRSISISTTIK